MSKSLCLFADIGKSCPQSQICILRLFVKMKFSRKFQINSIGLQCWFACMFPVIINEPWHEISNNVVCATSKASDQPAHTRSLIRAFASRLSILWVLSLTWFGVSKLKMRLHRLVWVYNCQNATLLEITCRGSKFYHFLCYISDLFWILTLRSCVLSLFLISTFMLV